MNIIQLLDSPASDIDDCNSSDGDVEIVVTPATSARERGGGRSARCGRR